jgi:hypothetical protein
MPSMRSLELASQNEHVIVDVTVHGHAFTVGPGADPGLKG